MAGYGDIEVHDVGDRLRFRATFRNPDTLEYQDPDVVTAHIWRVGDDDTTTPGTNKVSVGVYDAFFTPTVAGDYLVEIRGTGNWGATLKRAFRAEGTLMPA